MVRIIPIIALCCFLSACIGGGSGNNKAPVLRMGQKSSSVGTVYVQEGDNLWHISKRYKIPMRDIITANNIAAPYTIYTGQRLKLPPPREYKVRSGDTLYEISRLFETDMRQIARLNNMRSPYTIREGQTLRVPARGRSFSSAQNAVPKPRAKALKKHMNVPQRSGFGRFKMPVDGQIISSYGPKKGGLHNDGVNIAAPRGSAVSAAENGVVAYVGDDIEGFGNLILVRHDGGYMTAYAHLEKINVKRGVSVKRGSKIGTVGASGNVARPQLHFEIRKGSKALNPQGLI